MGSGLSEGIEGADADVESEPAGEKPARPVVADEEEDSADDGEEAQEKNQDCRNVERLSGQLVQMIDEADKTGSDKENREDPNGDGAAPHVGQRL